MKINTQRLERQVYIYKNSKVKRQKDEQFQTILEILTNHIRAIKMYLLGYHDNQVSPKVQQYMLSNMMTTSSIRDKEQFLSVLYQNVKLAGFTTEDIEQLIYLELVKLINSFKYSKISFFQYVTYLLPRRIQSYFWQYSKDQLNQMNTLRDATQDQEFDDYLYNIVEEPEQLSYSHEDNIIFSKNELINEIVKNEIKIEQQIQHQIIKSKKRANALGGG